MTTDSHPLPYVNAGTWQTLLLTESSYQKLLRFFLAEFSLCHCGSCPGLLQNQAGVSANRTESSRNGTVLMCHLSQILYSSAQGLRSTSGAQAMLCSLACWALIQAEQVLHGPEPHLVFLPMVASMEGPWVPPQREESIHAFSSMDCY